jgi:hypothetical protein
MELLPIQPIATRVESGSIPKALEHCPGIVTASRFVDVYRLDDEAHTRAL